MTASAVPPDPFADRRLYATRSVVAVLVVLTLWRVLEIAASGLNLSFDEAQYWLWSQDLDWGYFSKPPVVAWVIAATTALFGEAEWAVKLGAPLANAGTALLIHRLGLKLYDRRVAFWGAVVFATIPGIALSSMVITVDPFLLFFWAAGLVVLYEALETRATGWWLGLGLIFGLGMLSKYAMMFFVLCAAVYIAWSPDARSAARARGPWLALGLGLLVFLPNVIWNAGHGFLTFVHTKENANLGGPLFHPDKGLEFIGSQFGVFGPLLFAVALWLFATVVRVAREDERQRFLISFMLPVFAIMAVQGFLSRANANWAAPIYVAGSLLVVGWLFAHRKAWVARVSVVLHVLIAAAVYNYQTLLPLVGRKMAAKTDPAKRIRGWEALGVKLSRVVSELPEARLFFDDRKVMAPLIFYMRPHPFDAVMWNADRTVTNHYEQAMDLADVPIGDDVILITDEPDGDHVKPWFESVRYLNTVEVPVYPDYALTVRLYRAEGFRGYDHPVFPDR